MSEHDRSDHDERRQEHLAQFQRHRTNGRTQAFQHHHDPHPLSEARQRASREHLRTPWKSRKRLAFRSFSASPAFDTRRLLRTGVPTARLDLGWFVHPLFSRGSSAW